MYYIGIDLGTSAVKTLLMDAQGHIIKIVSRTYDLEFPFQGWSQQRPEDWEDAVFSAIAELICGIDAAQVSGIGVGGQMHGLVVLDDDDAVIRPAILWNDGRTGKETEWLNTVIGKQQLSSWTGNIAFAGFTAPKLMWMETNEPENFQRIRHILLPKDFVVHRLTGAYTCDYSDASGMLLLDVAHKCWSKEMMNVCHIKQEQLPTLYESYQVVGNLTKDAAKRLGLPETVKVVAGAGDNAAAAVGTGTVGAGKCNLSIGTSGTIFITNDAFTVDSHNGLHAFAHADGGFHLMGCMLSAAACNKWWMEDILNSTAFQADQSGITDAMLGCNSVYFLPYLMGERSPHNDPLARSAMIGMTLDTRRADMVQAVLEGVAFGIRDSLEIAKAQGIAVERSKICGGGAKSPLWRKIFANVLNLPLDIIEVEEGPGLGAAILAAVGCGEYATVEQAANAIVRVKDTIEPDPMIAARYEAQYDVFCKLYPTMKPLFPLLSRN